MNTTDTTIPEATKESFVAVIRGRIKAGISRAGQFFRKIGSFTKSTAVKAARFTGGAVVGCVDVFRAAASVVLLFVGMTILVVAAGLVFAWAGLFALAGKVSPPRQKIMEAVDLTEEPLSEPPVDHPVRKAQGKASPTPKRQPKRKRHLSPVTA